MTDPPQRTPKLLARLVYGIVAVGWIGMIGAGLQIVGRGQALVGIWLVGIGGVTLILLVRRFRRRAGGGSSSLFAPSGELRREQYDYIIWTAIGAPLLGVLLLVLVALTSGSK